eukprot:c9371_g1_i1.p1 GENE.c9371_g1_i1~~c9371_g1_i1.p1  ORF type:complete len:101 (+),score=48.40 c9371_g1_i1:13-315(+)
MYQSSWDKKLSSNSIEKVQELFRPQILSTLDPSAAPRPSSSSNFENILSDEELSKATPMLKQRSISLTKQDNPFSPPSAVEPFITAYHKRTKNFIFTPDQ